MAFRSEAFAGPTLVRDIQSQDFQPGVSGWSISAAGVAEFDGPGGKVIISNGQVRIYNATGQLVTQLDGPSGLFNQSGPALAQLFRGILNLWDTSQYATSAQLSLDSTGLAIRGPAESLGTPGDLPATLSLKPGNRDNTAAPALLLNGSALSPGWTSVKDYGAKGDGATDDTIAIQAALNACPAGGVVHLPTGVYRTSAPVNIPPYVALRGTHGGGEAQSAAWSTPCSIKPLPTFSGVAAVQILDQQLGGYSRLASEISIRDLTIDGSAVPAGTAVDGIRATGQIQHLSLRDVQVRSMTGTGINTTFNLSAPPGPQAPFCLHWDRVSVLWCASFGVALNNTTDSYFADVYVLGCSNTGWFIAGCSGTTWIGCRAEWSGGDGFQLSTNKGFETFIGCSTDRNARNGFSIGSSTSVGTIMLSGCRATRDGRSNGTSGYAGLNVDTTTRKVIADGFVTLTGADDDGSGLVSPQYGIAVKGSAYVAVGSGYAQGVSQGWHDGGGNTTLLRGTTVTSTP